jgi:chromosome partitioning protein
MNAPIIAFFNPHGAVGTTSLVYHLAWMYQRLGLQVLAIDLDPQANLTAMLLEEERLAELWSIDDLPNTVAKCLQPLMRHDRAVANPLLEIIEDGFHLLSGDLSLSEFEDDLSIAWQSCLESSENTKSVRLVSGFWKLITKSTELYNADVVLLDISPNLGSIVRSALLAADWLITPLIFDDFFSLQGLNHLSSTVKRWQKEWRLIAAKNSDLKIILPGEKIDALGYIIQQNSLQLDRSGSDGKLWLARVSQIYNNHNPISTNRLSIGTTDDPNCLAILKNYQGLMPMALTARKAMFQLKPADGAIGAYSDAVREVYDNFRLLAQKIAQLTQIENWPDFANYTHNYKSISEYKHPPSELPIRILNQNTPLFRIHNRDYGALHFNRYQTRFASPEGEYGVLYATLDVYAAFLEVIRTIESKIVPVDILKRRSLSKLYPQRDLKLVNISGIGLVSIGADSRIYTGSYQISQSWSQTFYEHPDRVDGIYYPSRYDSSRYCVALYESRILPGDLQEQRVTEDNLLDRSFELDLRQILDHYGYEIDDDYPQI